MQELSAMAHSRADAGRVQNMKACLHSLLHGCSLKSYEQLYELLNTLPKTNLPSSNWSDTSGWRIAEAIDGHTARVRSHHQVK